MVPPSKLRVLNRYSPGCCELTRLLVRQSGRITPPPIALAHHRLCVLAQLPRTGAASSGRTHGGTFHAPLCQRLWRLGRPTRGQFLCLSHRPPGSVVTSGLPSGPSGQPGIPPTLIQLFRDLPKVCVRCETTEDGNETSLKVWDG
jgi:hypothetical protein